MSIIDDIRSKSAQMQNSQTILKAFGEGETFEKGGKEKPEGSIYTRPDGRKFIKRGGKWVYHRENKGSNKDQEKKITIGEKYQMHDESGSFPVEVKNISKINGNIEYTGKNLKGESVSGIVSKDKFLFKTSLNTPTPNEKAKEEMQNKRDREERSHMLSEKKESYHKNDVSSKYTPDNSWKDDKSGAELKQKVDLAQGGAAGIRALMEREKKEQEAKLDTGKTSDIARANIEYNKLVSAYNSLDNKDNTSGKEILRRLNDVENYLGLPKTTTSKKEPEKSEKITLDILSSKGIYMDTLGKTKSGNYIVRKGFFYTGGKDSDFYVNKIKEAFPNVNIINSGSHWKPFKGGASVAQGSHFYVEFNLNQSK